SWYRAFCKTDICAHAIQKQTSLPLEQFFQSFRVNYAELDDKMKDDCHRKYMINRIRREHGIASSIFELEYDFINKTPKFYYSDGRVMIGFRDNIIVEDLKTRKKSIFQYLPKTISSNAGFSANLIFDESDGSDGRDETIVDSVIWNIFSRRTYYSLRPYVILTAATFQNQVGMVATRTYDFGKSFYFLIWEEIGLQRIEPLIENKHPGERIVKAGILFHPSKKGVIFITIQTRMLSMCDSSNYGTRITVYCYEDYELVSTQQEIIKTKTLPAEHIIRKYSNENQICIYAREPPFGWIPRSLKPYKFVHQTIGTSQGPESRWFPVQASKIGTPLDQEPAVDQERLLAENLSSDFGRASYTRWIKRDLGYVPLVQFGKSSDETFYEHLIYDMNTRQFTRFNIPLHPTYQECLFGHGSFIWNDQVFIRARHENVEKLQVVTLSKGLSGLWNGSVGKDDLSHSSRSSITRGENRLSFRSSPFEFQDGLQDNPDIKMYVDDNFVVLKASGRIKVWKFDEFKY
ncbi:hypothetical protein EPUL_005381, partial [Erysiphe pulchra]